MTVIDLLDGALSQYLMLYTRFADEKFSSVFIFMDISKNRFEKGKSAECTHYGFAETLLLGKPTKQGCMPAFCTKCIMRRERLDDADGVLCRFYLKQGF